MPTARATDANLTVSLNVLTALNESPSLTISCTRPRPRADNGGCIASQMCHLWHGLPHYACSRQT